MMWNIISIQVNKLTDNQLNKLPPKADQPMAEIIKKHMSKILGTRRRFQFATAMAGKSTLISNK